MTMSGGILAVPLAETRIWDDEGVWTSAGDLTAIMIARTANLIKAQPVIRSCLFGGLC